jgi:lysozyme
LANSITLNVALELIQHEGIVREAYRDSQGIWTWSVGITNASGHQVHPAYKDAPQPMRACLAACLERLEKNYVPGVNKAFKRKLLTEAQFAAALSFHFNTGAINTASWVKLWKVGDVAGARKAIMNWKKPREIIGRRQKERDLFFDGSWSNNGTSTEYAVSKPSYKPCKPHSVDVRTDLQALLL